MVLNKSRDAIFGNKLCEAFLPAGIPWIKLGRPKFCVFLESNTGISMPDRTAHDKKYLSECYRILSDIQDSLEDKPIWVGSDETRKAMGHSIMIEMLDNKKISRPLLANVVLLEKSNSATISYLINNTLKFL